MTTKKASSAIASDVDALVPESDKITLSSGSVVRVERLRTRGFFKLLKIVTRGGGPILMQMDLNFEDPRVFMNQFLAVVVMAIPEAEDEAIDFIRAMVVPAEFVEDAKSKSAQQKNRDLVESLYDELDDPHPEDVLTIIEVIIRNEAEDIVALGKRLAATLKVMTPSEEAKN